MSFTAFSTNTLSGVISTLKRPTNGLLRAFFREEITFDTETISFDVDEGKRYLAPYVHPDVPGKVVQGRGQQVRTFSPAYIKQKTPFNPGRMLKRAVGEAFGGALSPAERQALALAATLQDHIDTIDRRLEQQARSGLLNGSVTIAGDDYPSTVVSFGRHSDLNLAANNLTGNARWSETSTSNPLKDLDRWSKLTSQHGDSAVLDYVMDADAWDAFNNHPKVEKKLDLLKYDAGTLTSLEPVAAGLQLKGSINGYRIWLYTGWELSDAGVESEAMSGGYVLGVGAVDGVQYFGAIQDFEAGLVPMSVFPKSWVEQDPSKLIIMTQSAPLVVPRRINATVAAKVLNAS